MTAPDPGEGFRLVTDYSEAPHPEAEFFYQNEWVPRLKPEAIYQGEKAGWFYRVPDPVPEPVPLRWPDIPVSDDAWFQQPEPDSGADCASHYVAAWVLSAVMAVVLLLTGFILGWSWGG